MTTQELFQVVQDSDVAIALGQAHLLYGILAQLFHISGLVLLLTSILLVNLRLLGVGFTYFPVPKLARYTRPFILLGLVFLVVSGIFMLVPSAALYEPNPAFWLKLKLFAAALIVQFTLYHAVTITERPNRFLAVTTAVVSLLLWFSVGMAGRAISFVAA